MTISATYMEDLSRVRIEGSSLVGSTALVERSTDGATWTTVRGGTAVAVTAGAFTLDDYEFPEGEQITYRVGSDTDTITVDLDTIWIKAIQHPFLNRPVTVTNWSSIGRDFRGGVFPVVGRSYPVSVSDLRGSRRFTLEIVTEDTDDASDIDYLLASGGPVFVHVPCAGTVPQIYAVILGSQESRTALRSARRSFSLELQEVAKPATDVVGTTIIWQTLINEYPTWTAVLAEFDTWADVLAATSDPSSVIVE